MTRKYYTPEFKAAAACKVLDDALTIPEACDMLGVSLTAMRRWVRQLESQRDGSAQPNSKPTTSTQQQIRALEDEVKQLTKDRDRLRKATATLVQKQAAK